jgi:hypothetical protein
MLLSRRDRKIRKSLMEQINKETNYLRRYDNRVFTGQQILNLMSLATPDMCIVIVMSIEETFLDASDHESKYGL